MASKHRRETSSRKLGSGRQEYEWSCGSETFLTFRLLGVRVLISLVVMLGVCGSAEGSRDEVEFVGPSRLSCSVLNIQQSKYIVRVFPCTYFTNRRG